MAAVTIEEHEAELTELRSRVQEIDTEYAGQALPDEIRTEWNDINERVEAKTTLIEELRARQERIRTLAGDPANTDRPLFQTGRAGAARGNDIWDLSTIRMMSPDEQTRELQDRTMRAVEIGTFPHERANREDVQEHVERLVSRFAGADDEHGGGQLVDFCRRVLLTGSPTYQRAFGKALAGRALSADEQRSLSLTGASGGFAVPYTLDPTIIPTSNSSVNPMRAISRVETIAGSNEWRGVTSGAITASRDAEGTEVSDDAPTLVQPTLTVTKVAAFVPFSIEVGQDWGSLQAEMARLIQDAKDDEEATSFVTGAGTGQTPQGVVVGATGTVAAGSAAFAVAHLYGLEEALAPRFRPRASFIGNRAQYNRIRQFDTNGGAQFWMDLNGGLQNQVPTPGSTGKGLLGYPTWEASAMDSVLTAGSELLVFGDFRYYLIVDRIGMNVEVVPHLFGASGRPTGQRGIYAHWRNFGKVLSAAAFKTLQTT